MRPRRPFVVSARRGTQTLRFTFASFSAAARRSIAMCGRGWTCVVTNRDEGRELGVYVPPAEYGQRLRRTA